MKLLLQKVRTTITVRLKLNSESNGLYQLISASEVEGLFSFASFLIQVGQIAIMDTERLFISADFSKETEFKERLENRLERRLLEDGEIEEEQMVNVVAARGNAVTVHAVRVQQ